MWAGRSYMELFVLRAQICSEPKLALKNSPLKILRGALQVKKPFQKHVDYCEHAT